MWVLSDCKLSPVRTHDLQSAFWTTQGRAPTLTHLTPNWLFRDKCIIQIIYSRWVYTLRCLTVTSDCKGLTYLSVPQQMNHQHVTPRRLWLAGSPRWPRTATTVSESQQPSLDWMKSASLQTSMFDIHSWSAVQWAESGKSRTNMRTTTGGRLIFLIFFNDFFV